MLNTKYNLQNQVLVDEKLLRLRNFIILSVNGIVVMFIKSLHLLLIILFFLHLN